MLYFSSAEELGVMYCTKLNSCDLTGLFCFLCLITYVPQKEEHMVLILLNKYFCAQQILCLKKESSKKI